MAESNTAEGVDIHKLIQERDCDFHGFISKYGPEIDNHIETCLACEKRFWGWSENLPKMRKRKTVTPPDYDEKRSPKDYYHLLKAGQCLPCGCAAYSVPWNKEEATAAFYKAFTEVTGIAEESAKLLPQNTKLRRLPLDAKTLRRLRDTFWIPSGSYGSAHMRDAEEGEKVLQLPDTIADFIKDLVSMHSGYSVHECMEHDSWCPG